MPHDVYGNNSQGNQESCLYIKSSYRAYYMIRAITSIRYITITHNYSYLSSTGSSFQDNSIPMSFLMLPFWICISSLKGNLLTLIAMLPYFFSGLMLEINSLPSKSTHTHAITIPLFPYKDKQIPFDRAYIHPCNHKNHKNNTPYYSTFTPKGVPSAKV